MKNHAAYICGRFDGEMLSAETGRDHIHMLVSPPPEVAISKLVTTLKTQLSIENQRSASTNENTENMQKRSDKNSP